ncbi:hypothetical protein [Peribacillus frigoritolerans]|uniref:hypothetical protein n=1 Tax=Peribacillus frigoritolerans TaxID=450367 RepID=UPI00105AAA7D|nr:hypothetical protein [Peribacillus frigoritolerans]TDL80559.1 hypothetical protein E2R53_11145 [Peribacillus frigoritolerans]
MKKVSRFFLGLAQLIFLFILLAGIIFSGFMIYDSILDGVYGDLAIYIVILLFCMYFLGMLMEKNNFDGGAGDDFIALAVLILFVLLGGLVYHGINAAGKHLYWFFFPHRKPDEPAKVRKEVQVKH